MGSFVLKLATIQFSPFVISIYSGQSKNEIPKKVKPSRHTTMVKDSALDSPNRAQLGFPVPS